MRDSFIPAALVVRTVQRLIILAPAGFVVLLSGMYNFTLDYHCPKNCSLSYHKISYLQMQTCTIQHMIITFFGQSKSPC
jgi:hypothetical protein